MPITAEQIVQVVDGPPVRIIIIIVAAVALTIVLRLVLSRVIKNLVKLPTPRPDSPTAKVVLGSPSRTRQRLKTFQSVLNSTIAVVIGSIALFMVLSELGVAITPLLTSAGVVGVALAFGAQSLVRDIISGLFMMVEDQYGVGDRVELGSAGTVLAAGTVEQVALRITTLRDDDGRLWHVRNGEVLRVSNESQGWAQAVAQVQVAPQTDVVAAREAMAAVSAAMRADEAYQGAILADPEVRVEELTGSGITLRWSVRTTPGQQWRVASAMRRRIADEFAENGIELAG